MENVKEVLKLSVDQKGAVVPTGELTLYLDGLVLSEQDELTALTNGNTTNGSEPQPQTIIVVLDVVTQANVIICTNVIISHKCNNDYICKSLLHLRWYNHDIQQI